MRIAVLTTLVLIFSACGNPGPRDALSFIPTIKLKQGTTKTVDMSVYKTDTSVRLHFDPCPQLGLEFDPLDETLTLTSGSGSSRLHRLSGSIDGQKFMMLVQILPMVEHTFTFKSPGSAGSVVVMGGFNDWSRTALPMNDLSDDDILERTVYLAPQRHEYKFVVDSEELIDPENPVFISNNIGGWNSILDLSSYKEKPPGSLIKKTVEGNSFLFQYLPPEDMSEISSLTVTLNNSILQSDWFSLKNNILSIHGLGERSGTLRILATDIKGRVLPENITIIKNGRPITPVKDPDDWHFAIVYNMMIDRFRDGDPENNDSIVHPDLHRLANFQGGDFRGIIDKIRDGYLKNLGINAIWVSPVQKQPDLAYREWITPNRVFTGYHGYWPVKAREIEPRFGTSEEFSTLVNSAHDNGIRVLLDFVSNHVHEEHDYYRDHPEWFGSVKMPDGSMNIRNWSEETRLTTWFDEFIPSFNYSQAPEAVETVVDDAMWWLKTYNLDGFRQDAVKHVPHTFWKAFGKALRKADPEKVFYQIGETFGSDELIGSYVNPLELSAQFNFSIYFNARGPFSEDRPDFSNLSVSIANNIAAFGPVHLMGNITSSHDQLRFISCADKQVTLSDNGTERSFINPPGVVKNPVSYKKLRNFHALNFALAGVPVVYYGEEIGLMGAGDPGNRRMMRFDSQVTKDEKALKESLAEMAKSRGKLPALSIGDWTPLLESGETFVFMKSYFDEYLVVIIHQSPENRDLSIVLPVGGTRLIDLINGDRHRIENQNVSLTVTPYSYHYLRIDS